MGCGQDQRTTATASASDLHAAYLDERQGCAHLSQGPLVPREAAHTFDASSICKSRGSPTPWQLQIHLQNWSHCSDSRSSVLSRMYETACCNAMSLRFCLCLECAVGWGGQREPLCAGSRRIPGCIRAQLPCCSLLDILQHHFYNEYKLIKKHNLKYLLHRF